MPRLNSRGQGLMGVGNGPLSVDGREIHGTGGGPSVWYDRDHVLHSIDSERALLSTNIHTGTSVEVGLGVNECAANEAGRYLGWRPETVLGAFQLAGAGLARVITDGRGAAGADGTLAFTPNRADDHAPTMLIAPNGEVIGLPPAIYGLHIFSFGRACWNAAGGRIGTVGLPDLALLPGASFCKLELLNGELWVVYLAVGVGLVAHEATQKGNVYIIERGEHCYHHDARVIDAGTLAVAYSTTTGESPTHLVKHFDVTLLPHTAFDDLLPRKPDPISLDLIESLDGELGVLWYEMRDPPKMLPPGNGEIAVGHPPGYPKGTVRPRPVLAMMSNFDDISPSFAVQLGSEGMHDDAGMLRMETLAKELHHQGIRPFVYWDDRRTPRPFKLPPGSVFAFMAYCAREEDPEAFRLDVHEAIKEYSNHYDYLQMACQAFDVNPDLIAEPTRVLPAYIWLIKKHRQSAGGKLIAVSLFNHTGRDWPDGSKGGLSVNPQWHIHYQKAFGLCTFPQWLLKPLTVPVDPPQPPTPKPPVPVPPVPVPQPPPVPVPEPVPEPPRPQPEPVPVPPVPPTPEPPSQRIRPFNDGSCVTPRPGPDWTCYRSGWYPPDIPIDGPLPPRPVDPPPIDPPEPPMPVPAPPKVKIVKPKLSEFPITLKSGETLTCVYEREPDAGPIDTVQWLWKEHGVGGWIVGAVNDQADDDHTYRIFERPGTYEIVLQAFGPGGNWQTGAQRLVRVEPFGIPPTPDPEPPPLSAGDVITLKTVNGYFLSPDTDGRLIAIEREPKDSCRLVIEPHGAKVAIRSLARRQYLHAEHGRGPELMFNRDVADIEELFALEPRGDGMAFRTGADTVLQAVDGGGGMVRAVRLPVLGGWETFHLVPMTAGGGGSTTAQGRMRVESGRFANDSGFVGIHAISEFSAIHQVRTGNEGDIVRRFDRAASARRNVVRVFAMARNLFDLQPSQPGYWEAVERAVQLASERGLYMELCFFPDAQHVMPSHDDRLSFMDTLGEFCREHLSVIPQISNEPLFNGFEGANDPRLFELADRFKSRLGHVDFSIGDPPDIVNNEHTGEPLTTLIKPLADRSNILVLHGSRQEDPSRYARWVDHLKGFNDLRSWVRSGVAFWHDEPTGMAGIKDVPLPNGRTYRREDRAEALVAAACVSAVCQIGFTTHYISEQHDIIPGLEASAIAADIPQTPDWRFINAALPGSPITGFDGFEKVRPSTNGQEAWAVAYGHQKGSLRWADGFRPERVFNGSNVEVWRAAR